MSNPATQLRQNGLRATGPRLAVLRWLQAHATPISVDGLRQKIKGSAIDRVTVYRILESLVAVGLVRTVDLGHGHAHYEYNDPERHHHHFVCDACGRVEDVAVPNEAGMIHRLARKKKYSIRSHSFEIFGLCAECQ